MAARFLILAADTIPARILGRLLALLTLLSLERFTLQWWNSGGERIIWGAMENSNALNTGGRYNPTANTWSVITITDAPDARFGHTAVWTWRPNDNLVVGIDDFAMS